MAPVSASAEAINRRKDVVECFDWMADRVHPALQTFDVRDLRTGIHLCALLNSIKPGTIPPSKIIARATADWECKKNLLAFESGLKRAKVLSMQFLEWDGVAAGKPGPCRAVLIWAVTILKRAEEKASSEQQQIAKQEKSRIDVAKTLTKATRSYTRPSFDSFRSAGLGIESNLTGSSTIASSDPLQEHPMVGSEHESHLSHEPRVMQNDSQQVEPTPLNEDAETISLEDLNNSSGSQESGNEKVPISKLAPRRLSQFVNETHGTDQALASIREQHGASGSHIQTQDEGSESPIHGLNSHRVSGTDRNSKRGTRHGYIENKMTVTGSLINETISEGTEFSNESESSDFSATTEGFDEKVANSPELIGKDDGMLDVLSEATLADFQREVQHVLDDCNKEDSNELPTAETIRAIAADSVNVLPSMDGYLRQMALSTRALAFPDELNLSTILDLVGTETRIKPTDTSNDGSTTTSSPDHWSSQLAGEGPSTPQATDIQYLNAAPSLNADEPCLNMSGSAIHMDGKDEEQRIIDAAQILFRVNEAEVESAKANSDKAIKELLDVVKDVKSGILQLGRLLEGSRQETEELRNMLLTTSEQDSQSHIAAEDELPQNRGAGVLPVPSSVGWMMMNHRFKTLICLLDDIVALQANAASQQQRLFAVGWRREFLRRVFSETMLKHWRQRHADAIDAKRDALSKYRDVDRLIAESQADVRDAKLECGKWKRKYAEMRMRFTNLQILQQQSSRSIGVQATLRDRGFLPASVINAATKDDNADDIAGFNWISVVEKLRVDHFPEMSQEIDGLDPHDFAPPPSSHTVDHVPFEYSPEKDTSLKNNITNALNSSVAVGDLEKPGIFIDKSLSNSPEVSRQTDAIQGNAHAADFLASASHSSNLLGPQPDLFGSKPDLFAQIEQSSNVNPTIASIKQSTRGVFRSRSDSVDSQQRWDEDEALMLAAQGKGTMAGQNTLASQSKQAIIIPRLRSRYLELHSWTQRASAAGASNQIPANVLKQMTWMYDTLQRAQGFKLTVDDVQKADEMLQSKSL